LTANKDFHYVSSVGVMLSGYVPEYDYYIFTEEDDLSKLARGNHSYIQSKFQAEQLVQRYRMEGINGTIYRVGNLTLNSQTHRTQENIEETMMYAHIKAMVNFKCVPKELTLMESSPVDYTALALVKMFDKACLANKVHHVFNPNILNVHDLLSAYVPLKKQNNKMEDFIKNTMSDIVQCEQSGDHSYLFMLYQFWLNGIENNHSTTIRVSQKKTEHILAKLGFHWPQLTGEMFREIFIKSLSSNATERN